jgi:diguanylate cyclase (GGDEF)-like protein
MIGRWHSLVIATLLCTAVDAAWAQNDAGLESALQAAIDLGGADPATARKQLAAIRAASVARGRLDLRLATDEAECRLLTDLDVNQVRTVAEAGFAAASDANATTRSTPAVRLALLRLRTCNTDAMFDLGEATAANAELEAILAESASDAGLASAHALALLERGLHRSRRGDLTKGQEDLLAACSTLQELDKPHDLELCLWHLAGHYRRVGDGEEALRLMTRLLDAAERRQARFDQGVYAYGIAQTHEARAEFQEALHYYEQSLAISVSMGDTSGTLYAEHGIGNSLVLLGQPDEALPHIERAATLLRRDPSDRLQFVRTSVLLATALTALGRPEDARNALTRVDDAVHRYGDELLLSAWLSAEAKTRSQLGHWRQAYEALSAWQAIDTRLQAQRQSEQSARLRMQFNREKDESALRAMEQVNAQGQRLRTAQALALILFVVLLSISLFYAGHKIRQSRRLQLLAMTDELTGLPNRRAMLAHLEDALLSARSPGNSLSLLMIDVDHFKFINDTYGHGVGDEVLRHLALVLSANQRTHDRLGRLGGEEFLAVLPNAGTEHAVAIAERMRQSVEKTPCITSAGAVSITVSIGVATSADVSDMAPGLMARADTALYAAKEAGRNAVSSQPADAVIGAHAGVA